MMNETADIRAYLRDLRICVVIPTYNNAGTLLDVIRSVSEYCADIIVVNDGSTDATGELLAQPDVPATVISYTPNKGKGTALVTGFREALKRGFCYAITIDSDGQHYASDIPLFAETVALQPDCLIVGSRGMKHDNMPQLCTPICS